jgi:hypothetical protein
MPNGWLSLSTDPFKSRRAQLSATCVIPGRAQHEPGISRFRVWSFGPSRNDGLRRHVSTNPVLDPLAAESLRPWGSAR